MTHCWHDEGIVLPSYPPQYTLVCCHCGAKATKRWITKREEGHGPHAPPVMTHAGFDWSYPDGVDSIYCPKAGDKQ